LISKSGIKCNRTWKFELDPNKNNENLKDRKYLYVPMSYNSRVIPIKITVKKYKEKESTERIYSITAIDVDIKIRQCWTLTPHS
jgi:hypothetical protein